MKILINLIFFILISVPAWATTWYIRTDGGTSTQCTGTTDAAYSSGSGQPCGLNHPNWVLPPRGESTTTKAASGDTIVIHGPEAGTGQYRIGCQNASTCRDATVNLTQSSFCGASDPYDCVMSDGTSSVVGIPSNITIIGCSVTGCGTKTRPQLWGSGRAIQVLTIDSTSTGATVQDLEITDHSGCGFRIGDFVCDETSSSLATEDGISVSGASSFTLKNLWIHGTGRNGLFGHTTGTVILDNVDDEKNGAANWDTDDGTAQSGTITFRNRTKITYAGAIEAYPLTGITANTRNDILEVVDQNNTNAGYGDGIGTHDGSGGTWTFQDSECSHNVQDCFDTLHSAHSGTVYVYRSRFEGNNGNNFKTSLSTVYIENSIFIGNCEYFQTSGITEASGFVNCRTGAAQPVAIAGVAGQSLEVANSTFWGNYDALIAEGTTGGVESCNGTESYTFVNDILYGGTSLVNGAKKTSTFFCGGSDGNGAGACCTGVHTIVPVYSYDDVFNTQDSPTGTGLISSDPHLAQGDAISVDPNTDLFNVYLTGSSTALVNTANNAISLQGTSNDANNFSRGSAWDIGSLQHTTCALTNGDCSNSGQCCNGTCSNLLCSLPSSNVINGSFQIKGKYFF